MVNLFLKYNDVKNLSKKMHFSREKPSGGESLGQKNENLPNPPFHTPP
jgi:hypothetical protein